MVNEKPSCFKVLLVSAKRDVKHLLGELNVLQQIRLQHNRLGKPRQEV